MSSSRSSSPSDTPAADEVPESTSRSRRGLFGRPKLATNLTFGALYTVDGAILPFLSVYLAHIHGLSNGQIGMVLAVSALAAVVAPPVVSMLADRFGRAEQLFMGMLLASAVALAGFSLVSGYVGVLLVFLIYSVTREPARPLLDGIFFTAQRTVPEMGRVSYHRARMWGTGGYMVPGVLLFFTLGKPESLGMLPLLSCGLAVLGVIAAYYLPTRRRHGDQADASSRSTPTTMPLLLRAIGRLVRQRSTVLFLAAMLLLQISAAVYMAFYPIQATDGAGLSARWLGLVTNLGVAIELGYIAAFGWLIRRLGWRWLMVLGAVTAGCRVALLASFPTVGVVVGTQAVHGLVIVATMVAGRVVLDQRAPNEIRHTTQGLYAMLVLGGGKVLGSAVGGWIAASSLSAAFWAAAGTAFVAAGLLAIALRTDTPDRDLKG